MTETDKARLQTALRTLDQGPKRIAAHREQFKKDIDFPDTIRDKYSQKYMDGLKQEAQTKRDKAIEKEVNEIRSALEVVKELRDFGSESIDIMNPKLQSAITIINTMGRDLPASSQLSIAEQFRGDIGSLKFLSQLYKKNGYFYADQVAEMTKTISQAAIDNMAYNVNRYDYCGKWDEDSDSHIYWTRNEFAKAANRLGFDDTAADPFESVLYHLKTQYADSPKVQHAAAHAIQELRNDREMTRSEREQYFNEAVQHLNDLSKETQDLQLRYEAAQGKAEAKASSNGG